MKFSFVSYRIRDVKQKMFTSDPKYKKYQEDNNILLTYVDEIGSVIVLKQIGDKIVKNGYTACFNDYQTQHATHFRDINEKYIYEGDIVKSVSHSALKLNEEWCEYTKGEVVWQDGALKIQQKNVGSSHINVFALDHFNCGLEITGNIFEEQTT